MDFMLASVIDTTWVHDGAMQTAIKLPFHMLDSFECRYGGTSGVTLEVVYKFTFGPGGCVA